VLRSEAPSGAVPAAAAAGAAGGTAAAPPDAPPPLALTSASRTDAGVHARELLVRTTLPLEAAERAALHDGSTLAAALNRALAAQLALREGEALPLLVSAARYARPSQVILRAAIARKA
jgi:tRNA U38,U39,U40 pseudouridine synthase TruA